MPRLTTLFTVVSVSLLAMIGGSAAPSCAEFAQGAGCAENCKAAYGSCYKATANRAACEAQLQRCLQNCLGGKSG